MSSSFELTRIHHVLLAIPSGSEDICRAFWGDILGLVEVETPLALQSRGGCWFKTEGLEIHLGVEEDFAPAKKAHPAIIVDNLDALEEHLILNDVKVTCDGGFPGYRRLYIFDPFGNRIELLEPWTSKELS